MSRVFVSIHYSLNELIFIMPHNRRSALNQNIYNISSSYKWLVGLMGIGPGKRSNGKGRGEAKDKNQVQKHVSIRIYHVGVFETSRGAWSNEIFITSKTGIILCSISSSVRPCPLPFAAPQSRRSVDVEQLARFGVIITI